MKNLTPIILILVAVVFFFVVVNKEINSIKGKVALAGTYKEAMNKVEDVRKIKTDNSYYNQSFNTFIIKSLEEGQSLLKFLGFQVRYR